MRRKLKKKVKKILIIYVVALIVGVALFFACRPYARAHREDPTKPGGEYLLIVMPAFLLMFGRNIASDMKCAEEENRSEADGTRR